MGARRGAQGEGCGGPRVLGLSVAPSLKSNNPDRVDPRPLGPSMTAMRNHLIGGCSRQAHFFGFRVLDRHVWNVAPDPAHRREAPVTAAAASASVRSTRASLRETSTL
jgi:hypothetical protein